MLIRLISVFLIVCALTTAVIAHTPLKETTPASGSILDSSPDSVRFEFGQAVRMTLVRVEAIDGSERRLAFSPSGSSAVFETEAPNLAPGKNAVHWTALSPDGHVIEGVVILIVRTAQTSEAIPKQSRLQLDITG